MHSINDSVLPTALEMPKFSQTMIGNGSKESVCPADKDDVLPGLPSSVPLVLPVVTEFFHVHVYHVPDHLRS